MDFFSEGLVFSWWILKAHYREFRFRSSLLLNLSGLIIRECGVFNDK